MTVEAATKVLVSVRVVGTTEPIDIVVAPVPVAVVVDVVACIVVKATEAV